MGGGRRTGAAHAAGFVLVGGRSSRMGRDKALLCLIPEGPGLNPPGLADLGALAEQIFYSVFEAAGSVTFIGDPTYASLGLPVIADGAKGGGLTGGIYTALLHSKADWNLVVACDVPGLAPDFLLAWIQAAGESPQSCLVSEGPGGVEPLCAVPHRRLLSALESAWEHKQLKMKDFVLQQNPGRRPVGDASALRNIDTPKQWRQEVA